MLSTLAPYPVRAGDFDSGGEVHYDSAAKEAQFHPRLRDDLCAPVRPNELVDASSNGDQGYCHVLRYPTAQ